MMETCVHKIKKNDELFDQIKILKNKNLKIVFTNGCFDILHRGHVLYLEKAKKMGDFFSQRAT